MKRYLLSTLAVLATIGMTARHLSPEEALGRLSSSSDAMRAPASVRKAPRLVYSAKTADLERVYVFGNAANKGFMVLSADDSTPALLAYSDTDEFDFDNMPDNMRYWLDEYARQVAYASTQESATDEPQIKQRPDVAPKLTTLWDQTEPFNTLTPTHNALPCPTGCVATAVAQIMNWHKWPEQGTGQKSYTSYYIGTLSLDFEKIKFDWDKMLDRYYQYSPSENIDAVGTLMLAAGYASEMSYHQKSSGAMGYNAARGLMTHLGYSKAMSLECREWYEIEEWDDLVYAELTENGPVYYEGTGDGGGHAFVCDGYDSKTGFFHFNWGWSGRGNGYYRLSALNPTVQGTGGNSLGYNYSQDIIKGLKKAPEGVTENYTYIVGPRKGVMTPWIEAELGQSVTIKGYETEDGFNNYSVVPIPNLEFGVRFYHETSKETLDILSQNGTYDFNPYNKTNIIRYTVPTTLAEGEYIITPLWRSGEKDSWHEMRMSPQTRNYIPATVTGNKIYFGLGEADGRIEAKITEAPDFFTTAGEFTIKGSMSSVGTADFSGLICAVFVTLDKNGDLQIVDQGEAVRYDVEHGKTIDFEYTSFPKTQSKLTDGDDYGIVIGNANTGELVSPIYKIAVGNRYGKLSMSTYNFSISGSNYLDPQNINVKFNIKVVAGEYEGPLAIGYSLKKDPFEAVRYTVSEPMHFIAGDEKQVSFTGILDNVEAGELYFAHLMYKVNDEWTPLSVYPISVLVAQTFSGVENVAVDDSAEAVYYDTFGRKVENPAKGNIYIRVSPDGKVSKVAL